MALMALMMCFVTGEAYAYDIEVENEDGVTIYYNYINEGRELEVTYRNYSYNSYSGSVVIPEEVTFMNSTRKVTSIGSTTDFPHIVLSAAASRRAHASHC